MNTENVSQFKRICIFIFLFYLIIAVNKSLGGSDDSIPSDDINANNSNQLVGPDMATSVLPVETQNRINKLREDLKKIKSIERYTIANFNHNVLKPGSVVIWLPDDKLLNITLGEPEKLEDYINVVSWIGNDEKAQVQISITVRGEKAVGTISIEDESYRLWTIDDGICVVAKVSKLPDHLYY